MTLGNVPGTVLTVGADDGSSTFSGSGSGSGNVTKAGSGTLTLSGTNTYVGTTTVSAGTLRVDGSVGGTLALNGGTLSGKGTVGAVTAPGGGTVAPGDSAGVLTAASAAFNEGTTFSVELNGPTPGNGLRHYDQLVVHGPVTLGGAVLEVSLGYVPDPATAFTILQSTGAIWARSPRGR